MIALDDDRLDHAFWAMVSPEPNSGCWLWLGALHHGYGALRRSGRTHRAHKFAYERLVARVPDGLVLDHECDTRCCVNPQHLTPTTNAVNTQRSPRWSGNATHCPKGHEYTEANTWRDRRGWRWCRTCHREREAARHRAKLENGGGGRGKGAAY